MNGDGVCGFFTVPGSTQLDIEIKFRIFLCPNRHCQRTANHQQKTGK